jgi:hypothetical protein
MVLDALRKPPLLTLKMPNFPNGNIKESQKNENFHREWVDAIIGQSLTSTYSVDYNATQACYDYFNTGSNPKDFSYLQTAPDSSVLPATWQTINKIYNKVMVLVGELMERGYDFEVSAINKEAKSRKLEAKEEARVMMRISPHLKEMDEYAGINPAMPRLPETEEELDEYYDKNYKEEAEIIMYHALKYLDKKNGWDYERMALFRDLLIAGKCIVRNEIVDGIPVAKRVDPRFFIFDSFANDDFASDATYYGELEYVPMAQAAEQYGLTMEEIKGANEKFKEYCKILETKTPRQPRHQELNVFDSLSQSSGLKWFKEGEGGTRVLVCKACWMDYKKIKIKESEDKYGNIHAKRMKSDSQDREGVISKNIKIWRKGTLIGGKFMKDWGIMENMARDTEASKIAEAYPPYLVLTPNFLSGRSISPVERSKGLQNLKDIITYQVQLAMARAGSAGFVYDVSQCPDDWDVDTVIKYLKTVGIAFINSKQGGTPSQFNQFQAFDLSLSSSVTNYLELTRWIDSEMDSVFGVNEARQGVVQGASQAVGVTRSALLQSSLTTAPYFKLFDQFSSKVWNHQAKLVKIAWANKERFAPIIGDTGIDFLTEDIELDLDDYGAFVQVTPKILDDIQNLQTIIMAALQAGQLTFVQALTLLKEKDVMTGIRKFEKMAAEAEKAAQEQEMKRMEQEAQMKQQGEMQLAQWNAQQQAQASEKAQQLQGMKTQSDFALEQQRHKNTQENDRLGERHELLMGKLEGLLKLQEAELKAKEEKRKAKSSKKK